MNPRNVLEDEASYQADGVGTVGNIKCGDQMLVAIQVKDGIITDCKWKTYGCASAIASTSMLYEAGGSVPHYPCGYYPEARRTAGAQDPLLCSGRQGP